MSSFWVSVFMGSFKGLSIFAASICFLLAAELLWPRGDAIPALQRWRAMLYGAIYIPIGNIAGKLVGAAVPDAEPILAVGPITALAIVMLGRDFLYYWYHRAQHSIGWLWRIHAVHHSAEELGAGTGYHHLLEAPLKALMVGIPLGLLIKEPWLILTIIGIHGTYLHSTTRLNFGRLAAIVADNRIHRIHHSRVRHHFDRNFGQTFMLWDWLFGTAHFPKPGEWPATGLDDMPEPRTVRDYVLQPFAAPSRAETQRASG